MMPTKPIPTPNSTNTSILPTPIPATTVINCGVNEIFQNGSCVCSVNSFKNALGQCEACPPAHFINSIICLPCLNNCQNCTSS